MNDYLALFKKIKNGKVNMCHLCRSDTRWKDAGIDIRKFECAKKFTGFSPCVKFIYEVAKIKNCKEILQDFDKQKISSCARMMEVINEIKLINTELQIE